MNQAKFMQRQYIFKPMFSHSNFTLLCAMLTVSLSMPGAAEAGGACIVAKELGNSLAIEWIASQEDTVTSATEKAEASLRQQGFTKKKLRDIHLQASTSLPHAYMVIIKTSYTTQIGKLRTSYGCGFSDISMGDAERLAVKNLRGYSWGWKPEFGYELYAKHSY
ncbi:MAG: hypothetical protein P8Z39_00300 [Gammaproteobacteria bacterium]